MAMTYCQICHKLLLRNAQMLQKTFDKLKGDNHTNCLQITYSIQKKMKKETEKNNNKTEQKSYRV